MNQALSALSHNNPVERFCFLTDHLETPKEIFTEAGRLVWAVVHDTWRAYGWIQHIGRHAIECQSPITAPSGSLSKWQIFAPNGGEKAEFAGNTHPAVLFPAAFLHQPERSMSFMTAA